MSFKQKPKKENSFGGGDGLFGDEGESSSAGIKAKKKKQSSSLFGELFGDDDDDDGLLFANEPSANKENEEQHRKKKEEEAAAKEKKKQVEKRAASLKEKEEDEKEFKVPDTPLFADEEDDDSLFGSRKDDYNSLKAAFLPDPEPAKKKEVAKKPQQEVSKKEARGEGGLFGMEEDASVSVTKAKPGLFDSLFGEDDGNPTSNYSYPLLFFF